MPYEVARKGDHYVVRNRVTGKVYARHASKENAQKQLRLLEGIEHGWRPTRRR